MFEKLFPFRLLRLWLGAVVGIFGIHDNSQSAIGQIKEGPLPGTKLLEMNGDIASELVAGVDRFLLRELEKSIASRERFWHRNYTSPEAYSASIKPNRERLKRALGMKDALATNIRPRLEATLERASLIARTTQYEIHEISWPAFGDVRGYGLLVQPVGVEVAADVLAIPDCESTPEQLVGLSPGLDPELQSARLLAEQKCRVLVPLLVSRAEKFPGLTNREWLYRPAFELGRGLIGYEVLKIQAAIEWLNATADSSRKLGVYGWGEGGLLALYSGAADERIDAVAVSGYFQSRQRIWQEPIDRNVFGLLREFGDAEVASLIAPRALVIDARPGPERHFAGGRGAPADLSNADLDAVTSEFERARTWQKQIAGASEFELTSSADEANASVRKFLKHLNASFDQLRSGTAPEWTAPKPDYQSRQDLLIAELDRHSQQVLQESEYVRMNQTIRHFDFSNLTAYEESAKNLRQQFYENVIGKFESPILAPHPRTRVFRETEQWICYEVVLDVFPEVFAYGLLLVPKGLQPGERRPVVVCQHGLEGRPQDTIGEPGYEYYSAFASRLAERGFVTFAPQNLYIFGDRFRKLQRMANPLGMSLFSIITPQHQQIVDWLQQLDFVDANRIGFYGLSYGGKTAMRVPAVVTDYCLSICSADFNEWVDKNASTRNPHTYASMGEYEIFEFDLGNTFNYAEMAALIAPRPFMVERGHFDNVADDWTVAYEYAKVRFLYSGRLGMPERTEIEWFNGPHKINGVGTFKFLHRHLNWPEPAVTEIP